MITSGNTPQEQILAILKCNDGLPLYEIAHAIKNSVAQTKKLLHQLIHTCLITTEKHGRHLYYRHHHLHIALNNQSLKTQLMQLLHLENDCSFQNARTCYGHLAGKFGVVFFRYLLNNKFLIHANDHSHLTNKGLNAFYKIDLNLSQHLIGNFCLDYTERCYHLGGDLGKLITKHLGPIGSDSIDI